MLLLLLPWEIRNVVLAAVARVAPSVVACVGEGGVALGVVSVRSGGRAAINMHGHYTC